MKTTALLGFLLILLAVTVRTSLSECARPAPAAPAAYRRPVPAAGRLHRVAAAHAGRVWEVYAAPGAPVQRGALLAKLAVPLHSVAQQQREAELRQAQTRRAQLLAQHASAPLLAHADRQLAAVTRRVADVPAQYTFVFVTAPASGTVAGQVAGPGQYLTDSSTVAVIAEPAALARATAGR